MDMIWPCDVMATHSLTGKVSNAHKDKEPKPSLDVGNVAALCGMCSMQYYYSCFYSILGE